MRAFVIAEPGRHEVREIADPTPGPGEVMVAPSAVGLCGSDVELLTGQRPARYVHYPIIPGHEWVGTVVACGPGVIGLEPGAQVVAEGVRTCGRCRRCGEGRNNLCTGRYAETGFTHAGALAERLVIPADLAHVLPGGRSTAAAALIEPAACVATGLLEVGHLPPGASVAVVGDGPLALLAVTLLRLSAPAELLVVGSRARRAARAKALGATETVLREDLASVHHRRRRGSFDLVLEATNSPEGSAAAIGLARRAGTVVLLGISGSGVPAIDPDAITLGHLRVQGVFAASRAAWQWLVSLYSADLFDPAGLITHRFALEAVEDAFAVMGDRDADALKIIIEPNGHDLL
jgi:threonine dehydrogenase-like Zn-dependent dehydrogenase